MRPTMAFPSAPSVLWSVSLLTVLLAAAVHSNIGYGKHISPCICLRFCLSHPLSLSWASDLPTLSLSLWWCPLSVDLRHFRCFLCYDKGITAINNHMGHSRLPKPQWLATWLLFFYLSLRDIFNHLHTLTKRCTKADRHTRCSASLCLSHMRDVEIGSNDPV